MARVLVFDGGMNLGFAALGGGRDPFSGCRRLRGGPRQMGATAKHCNQLVRELIAQEKPTVVGFASPFIGQTFSKPMIIKGRKIAGRPQPISPDSIRPLFGCLTVIEMVCEDMGIRCVEIDEPEARRAFLTAVPRKSKDIKLAIQRACTMRRWCWQTEHDADALCVASFILECEERGASHKLTPLFIAPGAGQ